MFWNQFFGAKNSNIRKKQKNKIIASSWAIDWMRATVLRLLSDWQCLRNCRASTFRLTWQLTEKHSANFDRSQFQPRAFSSRIIYQLCSPRGFKIGSNCWACTRSPKTQSPFVPTRDWALHKLWNLSPSSSVCINQLRAGSGLDFLSFKRMRVVVIEFDRWRFFICSRPPFPPT